MAFVKTSDRKTAYTAVINMLLQDNKVYCNNCGATFLGTKCCDEPEIGTNADVARAVALQCTQKREQQLNDYASNKGKNLRYGLSLPVFIYEALDNYEKSHGRRLINDVKDIRWLCRNFPQYAIPRRI